MPYLPRKISLSLTLAITLAQTPTVCFAAAPAEAASCVACHGAQGEGMRAAGYPRLAGLSSEYIGEQLRAYADGRRTNAIMTGMAKALRAEQIKTLATYFGTLPNPNIVPAPAPEQSQALAGQQLAERGDWNAGIPACFNCHAPGGIGIQPHFPPIVGQPAAYIEAQIKAWQNGTRRSDPQNLGNALMQAIATRMNDNQTQSVAAWLAAQPSTTAPMPAPAKP